MAACLSGLGGPNWAWICSVPMTVKTPSTNKENSVEERFM
jgi:hypothetical protein